MQLDTTSHSNVLTSLYVSPYPLSLGYQYTNKRGLLAWAAMPSGNEMYRRVQESGSALILTLGTWYMIRPPWENRPKGSGTYLGSYPG